MKNKSLIYVLIGLVCAALLFILFYLNSEEGQQQTKKALKIERKPNDWYQTFGPRNLHPYGTFIFYQLLKNDRKNKVRNLRRNSQYKYLDTIKDNKRLYVYVGKTFATHPKRIEKVLKFVHNGNDAFIAADILPTQVRNIIADYYRLRKSYYKSVRLNFKDTLLHNFSDFNFKFIFKRKNIYRYWTEFERTSNYYTTYTDSQSGIEIMETNTESFNPVYITIPYGKGKLYLHTNPYTLTNVVMKYERGVEHAERVIATLPDEKIIFDSYLNSKDDTYNQDQYRGGSNDGQPHRRSSPLQFILENQSLRWAYYLLLAGLLLYIFTKGKRLQKIIPPKDEIENTSIEFAETMSKLYLQYGQHKYIVFQQEKNLMNYIRNKYYLKSLNVDDDYLEKLATKSGIEKQKLANLFNRFKKTKKANHASSTDVVEIYAEIEYFHKNCK